ncbi:MAG: oligosaccharide flippase family protein [bacterium]
MIKKDNLIKDSIILFIATNIVNFSNFFFHMLVSRPLGPEKYGTLVTLISLFGVIATPAGALQLTIVKKTATLKAKGNMAGVEGLFKKSSIWFLTMGVLAFAVIMIFSGLIMDFFKITDRWFIVIVAALTAVSIMLPTVRGILQGLQKFVAFGFNLITDALLRLGLAVFFIFLGWGVFGALSASLVSALVAYAIGFAAILFLFKNKQKDVEIISKKELLKYALPVLFSMFGMAILTSMDIFMVKHFFNPEDAGLYSATSIIGKAFLYFPSAIAIALFPKVAEIHALNKDAGHLLNKSMLITGAITLVGGIFCFFFPKVIIGILFGSKYYSIADVARWFGFAILPLTLFNILVNYSLAIRRYFFIYAMFAGIALYAALLWFSHADFYRVILNLFISSLFIFVLSMMELKLIKPKQRSI